MPKIINSFSADDSLSNAFSAFRDNESYRVLQEAERAGGYDPNDPLVRAAIVGLDKPVEYSQAQRFIASTRHGAASPQATNAYVGAGGSYGGTVAGTREGEQTKYNVARMTTDRTLAHDRYKYENTPQSVLIDGIPRIVSQAEAIRSRMTPVLDQNKVQGNILANDAPTLTPEQRATAGGYAPKNPGSLWTYQKPDGSYGNTVDGRTDVQTGQPISGAAMKLEGPTTEGLSGDKTVDRERLNNRVATQQFATGIDMLISQLSKPDADQAGGWVGAGARLFNDIRSQTEAAVRLAGGETFAQAFDPKANPANASSVDSAMNVLLRNPTVVNKMQSLGIDNALLRSQLQDLAYMDAKAKDPGGRVSNEDIRRSMETIAGSVADPTTGIAVLQAAKQRATTNMEIRERNIDAMYRKPAPASAAQPAAPAQPQAAPLTAAPRRRYNPATGGIE
jgi:hypothetical protein